MPSLRYNLRHLMFAVTIATFAAWSISTGVSRTRHNIEASQSTYAARLVTRMCVRHMSANGGSWPKRWHDLRDDFAPCLARSRQSWTFDDLKERVGVDWNVSPTDLLSEPNSPNVIWVASDPEFSFHGTTPNTIVLEHLESAKPPQSTNAKSSAQ